MLAADRTAGRDIIEGTLGCPICHTEYSIVAGVARFGQAATRRMSPPDESESLRLTALLDLSDARGYAILVGETGSHAPGMRELTDVQLLLVDPPAGVDMGNGLSGLTTNATSHLPLAAASARASFCARVACWRRRVAMSTSALTTPAITKNENSANASRPFLIVNVWTSARRVGMQ